MRFISILFMFLVASTFAKESKVSPEENLRSEASSLFTAIDETQAEAPKETAGAPFHLYQLGKKLYFDKNLSASGTISCNSCHGLDTFGVDNKPTSPGHDGRTGDRNSPTVYNATYHTAQFWDGRAGNLEEQATGPLLNPIEHGIKDEAELISKISSQEYMEQFQKAFGNNKARTLKNVGVAISAFEKTLVTPSRFDDFLKGKLKSLNAREKKGLKKFIEVGCTSCHNGQGIGGEQFQKLGLVKDYPTKDLGRFVVTKNEEDKYMFKVPGRRT
jgi:cytochrome c peroxidase